ncbi:MAG: hypothetical protein ACRDJU_04000, partial [Actinomycetota bacterium]
MTDTQARADASGMPSPPQLALGAQFAAVAESAVRWLERQPALDQLSQTLAGIFSSRVQPGPVKDLLSGTWLGHPLHPMLTDVTIGAWTSALALDLVGGKSAAGGTDT